jgi:hypothetical protein
MTYLFQQRRIIFPQPGLTLVWSNQTAEAVVKHLTNGDYRLSFDLTIRAKERQESRNMVGVDMGRHNEVEGAPACREANQIRSDVPLKSFGVPAIDQQSKRSLRRLHKKSITVFCRIAF